MASSSSTKGVTATKNVPIFTCAACGLEVHGFMTVELDINVGSGRDDVSATGKVTGVRISHDCTPKITRSASGSLSGLTPGGSCRV
jgi:hypothetical protein